MSTIDCFTEFCLFVYITPNVRVVETWPNGPGRMTSRCTAPFIVENVEEMEFPGIDREDFTTKHDHAKWAISLGRSEYCGSVRHDFKYYDRFAITFVGRKSTSSLSIFFLSTLFTDITQQVCLNMPLLCNLVTWYIKYSTILQGLHLYRLVSEPVVQSI